MTTTTYRAQTDSGTKRWHAGTEASGNVCVCGAKLMYPADTRAFALKVAADKRDYHTDANLALIDCGACLRNKAYKAAQVAAEVTAQNAAHDASHPRATRTRRTAAQRNTVTETEAANLAATAAAATPQGPKPRRRQSRADKANAAQTRDRARRAAAQERADEALTAIDAALTEVSPE